MQGHFGWCSQLQRPVCGLRLGFPGLRSEAGQIHGAYESPHNDRSQRMPVRARVRACGVSQLCNTLNTRNHFSLPLNHNRDNKIDSRAAEADGISHRGVFSLLSSLLLPKMKSIENPFSA